jgi:biotin carboxyl carrier protein
MDQEDGTVRKKAVLSLKEIEAAAKAGEVRSQITGTVNEVCVTEGEQVAVGQILLVLEAMKMLNNVTSEVAGKVTDLHVSAGDKVTVGDPLLNISKE